MYRLHYFLDFENIEDDMSIKNIISLDKNPVPHFSPKEGLGYVRIQLEMPKCSLVSSRFRFC